MSDKRIEALIGAAERKKQEALKKTEEAIQALVKKNHKITIRSVAREAGVSVSYLYKYPELSHRIQTLREQQKSYPVKPQSPSSKSHQKIATQLRNRIKILEQEKEELSKEIKIFGANIYEMSKSENSLERLKAENLRLLEENKELRKQLEVAETNLFKTREYILTQGFKNKLDPRNETSKTEKVVQLITQEKVITPGLSTIEMGELDDNIQSLLAELGIKLNKTLIKEIKEKPREQVLNAISVVQENIDTGVKIRSKVGLFRRALKEEWVANEPHDERTTSQLKDEFSKWFDLAKEQGIVQTSKRTDEGIFVLKPGEGWVLFNDLVEKGWTLKYLKQRTKK